MRKYTFSEINDTIMNELVYAVTQRIMLPSQVEDAWKKYSMLAAKFCNYLSVNIFSKHQSICLNRRYQKQKFKTDYDAFIDYPIFPCPPLFTQIKSASIISWKQPS